MNRESLRERSKRSRRGSGRDRRNELWHKGETSGNTQEVVSLALDCDRDAIVVLVNPAGPACHTGAVSCFDTRNATADLGSLLDQLYELIQSRERERPAGSYTTYLFEEGLDKILKKVGEESAETIIAAKNDDDARLAAEVVGSRVSLACVAGGAWRESDRRSQRNSRNEERVKVKTELNELLEFAVELARGAGDITLQYFRKTAGDEHESQTAVTSRSRIDEAESYLRKQIAERFPDDGVLGEEEGESQGTSGRRWIRRSDRWHVCFCAWRSVLRSVDCARDRRRDECWRCEYTGAR